MFWIQLCSWMTFLCSVFSSFLSFCTFAIGAACVMALQPVSVIEKQVILKNWNMKCLLRLSQLKWVSEWEEESISWKIWRVSHLWQLGIEIRKGHSSQFYCCRCLQSTFAYATRNLWIIVFWNLLPSWSEYQGVEEDCKLHLPAIFIDFDSIQFAL